MTIFILIILIIAFIVWRRSKMDSLSKNIIFAYAAIWLISLFISSLGIQGTPSIQFKTLLLQLLHVCSFYFGYKLITIHSTSVLSGTSITASLDKLMKSKVFIVIISLFAIYSVYLLTQYYYVALLVGDVSDIRGAYYEGELYGHFFSLIHGFVLEPLNLVCLFTFAYSILYKRSISGVISLIAVLAYNTLSGGRFGYMTILEALLFAIFCFQQRSMKLKQVLVLVVAFFAIFSIISLVSAGRTGSTIGDSNAWENGKQVAEDHIVSYLGVPNLAFEYAVEDNYRDKLGGYQLGMLTFSSVETWFYLFVSRLGISYQRPLSRLSELTQDNYISLGSKRWNALYTSSLYYYLDLGLFGLFFFPFIFGLFTRMVVRKLYQKQSVYLYFLLGLFFLKMLFSVEMYSCFDLFFPIMVFVLYYLGNKDRKLVRNHF